MCIGLFQLKGASGSSYFITGLKTASSDATLLDSDSSNRDLDEALRIDESTSLLGVEYFSTFGNALGFGSDIVNFLVYSSYPSIIRFLF